MSEPGQPDERGARLRMRREAHRISAQHRQLDEFYALLADAMERGEPREARTALGRFGDALAAHFDIEDRLYFPALHGLHPELDGELAALVREHGSLLRELDDLKAQFETGHLEACEAPTARFVARLTEHEAREEALLARAR